MILKKLFLGFLSLLLLLFSSSGIFFYFSQKKNLLSLDLLNEKKPDLIAVFTGDNGRIPMALKLATKFPKAQVFISGVHENNTLKNLLSPLTKTFNPKRIIIDYWAQNTLENAIATLRILKNKKHFKNILIVSHDYHLLRISFILNRIRDQKESYHFYYLGKKTAFFKWRNLKIILKETIKYIRTHILFFFWPTTKLSSR